MAAGQSTIENSGRLRAAWESTSSWRYWVLGLLALALGIRLWNLGKQTFWIDEFTELLVVSQDLSSLSTFPDGFPPLGFLATRGWLEWGSFESARYLAVAYGIVTVALVGLAALRLGGKRAALFGLLISGLSPFLIWHSQELRPYSLVMMLAAASLLSLLRASESGRQSDWMLYGIINGLGLWSHYFFALTAGAGMVWLWIQRRDIKGQRHAVMAHLVTAVMALPLLALLPGDLGLQVEFQAEVASEDPSSFGIGPLGYAFFSFFSGFSLGPSLRELHESSMVDALMGGWVWIALFGGLALSLTWWVARRWRNGWVQLLVILVLLPVLAAGFLSVVADLGFRPRYVSWCIIPLLLLAAVALSRVSIRAASVALVVLVVASGVAYGNRHFNDRYGNEDLRAAMAEIDRLDSTGEMPVLVSADYMAPLASYYSSSSRAIVSVPEGGTDGNGVVAAMAEIDRLDFTGEMPVLVSADHMAPLASYYSSSSRAIVRVPEVGTDGNGVVAAMATVDEIAGGQPYFLIYTRAFHGDSGGVFLDGVLADSEVSDEVEFAGATLYVVVPLSGDA